MFETTLFTILWGFIIGVLVSAPMGPTGILVIQRTLNHGWLPGFLTGLGAALSDFIYALLTIFALSLVVDTIDKYEVTLQFVGSTCIILYGLYLWKSNPASSLTPGEQHLAAPARVTSRIKAMGVLKYFFTGFGLTVSNPTIVFFFLVLFSRSNFLFDASAECWWLYIIGFACIIAGAVCWWLLITWAINKVRNHFKVRTLRIINRCIASIMFAIALYGFGNGVWVLIGRHFS